MNLRHIIALTGLALGLSTVGLVAAQPNKPLGKAPTNKPVAPTPTIAAPAAMTGFYKPSKNGEDLTRYATSAEATVRCFAHVKHKFVNYPANAAYCTVEGDPMVSEVPLRCAGASSFVWLIDGVEPSSNAPPTSFVDRCKMMPSGAVLEATCPGTSVKTVKQGKDTCTQSIPVKYIYAPGTCNDANCGRMRIDSDAIVNEYSVKCPAGSTLTVVGGTGVYCKR